MSEYLDTAVRFMIWGVPVVFAITLHEAAHGYAARHFGDSTAYLAGRISLNPVRHIDLLGTIIVPLLIFFSSTLVSGGSGYLFGWAKPVPVNPYQLRQPRQNMRWVAAAGPLANLMMAVGWWAILLVAMLMAYHEPSEQNIEWLIKMALAGVQANVMLMLLNLLPIPPLDGGNIVANCLSPAAERAYERIRPYGFMILLFLLLSGVLERLLSPLIAGVYWVLDQSVALIL